MLRNITLILFFLLTGLVAIAQDITPPDTPVLDSVSVQQSTGHVYIGWQFSDSSDVEGYIIYRQNGVIWQTIDTVKSPYINHYLDTTAAANFHFEVYRIAAYDSSLNRSPMTDIAFAQSTLYSFPYLQQQNCTAKIKLAWNQFKGWSDGVKQYRIYCSVNYGPVFLLDTVSSSATYYDHTNLTDTSTYCYFVRAVSVDGTKTSTSNYTCAYTNMPLEPAYSYLNYVSDTLGNKISFSISTDTSADIRNYKLLRSYDINGSYDTITIIPNLSQTPYSKVDDYIDQSKRYYYKIVAFNSCNNIIKQSNIAGNIVLSVTSINNLEMSLTWNPYINWQNGVEKYNIYRITDNGQNELIKVKGDGDTVQTVDISEFINNNIFISGHFCFFIEAYENGINSYGVKGRSISNTACLNRHPFVFVPDAFSPNNDDINDIFKPSVTFISADSYSFLIYDRWGQILFSTNDCTEGWNGKTKGKPVKEGVYLYYLRYKSVANEHYVKCGYFTLIR